MYVMRLNTIPTWTRYHQLRLCRQLMMQQKHHQHGYKIHQLRQCRQLMMQQKLHQPCMHEYMTQQQYIYSEGEKNHKKGGLNCVFGNFFLYVLDNSPQVQSLK